MATLPAIIKPLRTRFSSSTNSLFYKALGLAFKSYLAGETNLLACKKAIFTPVPFANGPPAANGVQREITNEQLFRIANTVQRGEDSTIFSVDGGGTEEGYFERQYQYLINLRDPVNTKTLAAQSSVSDALAATKSAYAADVSRFQAAHATDSTVTFMDWMSKYGFEYSAAYARLGDAQRELAETQSEAMNDIQGRLASMLAAKAPTKGTVGTNMPTLMSDFTILSTADGPAPGSASSSTVPADSASALQTVYRPLHYLSGYDDTVQGWVEGFVGGGEANVVLELPLGQAVDSSWSDLGFSITDEVKPASNISMPVHSTAAPTQNPALGNGVPDLAAVRTPASVPSLDAVLGTATTTLDQAKVYSDDLLRSAHLRIEASGLQAFDIYRGLWNIDDIRVLLPDLLPTATASVASPFFKTTRLLLGYGVEISIVLDSRAVSLGSAPNTSQAQESFFESLDLPVMQSEDASYNPPELLTKSKPLTPGSASVKTVRKKTQRPVAYVEKKTAAAAETVVWKMSSSDSGVPVLLAALAVLT